MSATVRPAAPAPPAQPAAPARPAAPAPPAPPARPTPTAARALGALRSRCVTLPLGAFLGSRLLVGAAGALGVLALNKHDGSAAAAARHALGPVGYVLAGSVDRFDSAYYLAIAAHGFGTLASGKVAFFPLYPLLIRLLTPAAGSAVIAGEAISAASFLGALIMLHRLTELELGRRAADLTVALLCFAPLSFFFTAIYTESLFLALSVATLLAARRGHWRLACALGALATLTRSPGVLLAVALVVARLRERGRPDRALAWALALPAALIVYLAALAAAGYPLLAPFTVGAHWRRVTTGPLLAVAAAIWTAARSAAGIAAGATVYAPHRAGPLSGGAESIVLLVVLAICALALVACLRRLPLHYGVLAAGVLAVSLSSPVAGQPLESLDRYALTIFPLWMAAGAWLAQRRRLAAPVIAVSAALLVFYTLAFSSWSFVA